MVKRRSKVLLIGLDGATSDVIRPLVQEGRLPTIAKFFNEGSHGELISTLPSVSTVAWASLVTGTNPGKHGIFGLRALKAGEYATGVIGLKSGKVKPIWTILSELGFKVGVINVPFTFPPEKVNGFFITGVGSPDGSADITYPAQLYNEIQGELGDYSIEPSLWGKMNYEKADELLKSTEFAIEKRAQVTKYLMEKYPWDFLMVVFVACDRIPHAFWHCMDKSHARFNEKGAKRYRDAIRRIYERIDKAIETILRDLSEETTIIIASDHGMGSFDGSCPYLDLNLWLNHEGYLKLSKRAIKDKLWSFIFKYYFNLKPIIDKAKKSGFYRLFYKAKESARNQYYLSHIDWFHTKAYSNFEEKISTGIRINKKGREPMGIVAPGAEYEALREELIRRLKEIKTPGTDDRLIEEAYKKEELYQGKYLESAPDIIIKWEEKIFGNKRTKWPVRGDIWYRSLDNEMPLSGYHRRKGIFFAKGPHIKRVKTFDRAQIIDVAPTTLYCLGLPVPGHMDGQVLDYIFNESFLKENPIRHSKLEEFFLKTGSPVYSPEEKEAIEEKLKAIGYI